MQVAFGIVWAMLAAVFAAAAALLLVFVWGDASFLAYALMLVFVLGSIVAARSTRDAFARRARNNASA